MKCCASPTTSTAADAARARSAERDAAQRFEALVVQQAFAPLAKSMGFYGDVVVAAASLAMVRGSRDGFVERLTRTLDPAGGTP